MKLLLKIVAAIVGVVVALAAGLVIFVFVNATRPSRPVGFQQAVVTDAGHDPITVSIWYPTDSKPGLVFLGSSAQRVASKGRVEGAALPLVIISHGTGGAALSHVDTALALAEAGFVVVAPTHPGDNFRDDSAVGTSGWLVDRSRHVSRVADFMLMTWRDRGHLDGAKVGLFGFSAGATTALISIGGTPDLGRVETQCAAHPEFVCELRKPGAPLKDPGPAGWTHDPRISAAVIAAPGLGFTFEPNGLSGVTAAVQLWSGAADQTVPYATNAGTVARLLPTPPEAHIVPSAGHYAFLPPCRIGPPMLCKDGPGFDRVAFHKDFNARVVAFFKARLGVR
ncbi:MAG: dienelactone hydrolase family protein [Caulobacter sp.]|nr:dienelactone hydrolase family protein [Caulobacter sp.]